jgi:hypothetical protein
MASRLKKAIEHSTLGFLGGGTDEDAIAAIARKLQKIGRNDLIQRVFDEYHDLTDRDFREDLIDDYSGDDEDKVLRSFAMTPDTNNKNSSMELDRDDQGLAENEPRLERYGPDHIRPIENYNSIKDDESDSSDQSFFKPGYDRVDLDEPSTEKVLENLEKRGLERDSGTTDDTITDSASLEDTGPTTETKTDAAPSTDHGLNPKADTAKPTLDKPAPKPEVPLHEKIEHRSLARDKFKKQQGVRDNRPDKTGREGLEEEGQLRRESIDNSRQRGIENRQLRARQHMDNVEEDVRINKERSERAEKLFGKPYDSTQHKAPPPPESDFDRRVREQLEKRNEAGGTASLDSPEGTVTEGTMEPMAYQSSATLQSIDEVLKNVDKIVAGFDNQQPDLSNIPSGEDLSAPLSKPLPPDPTSPLLDSLNSGRRDDPNAPDLSGALNPQPDPVFSPSPAYTMPNPSPHIPREGDLDTMLNRLETGNVPGKMHGRSTPGAPPADGSVNPAGPQTDPLYEQNEALMDTLDPQRHARAQDAETNPHNPANQVPPPPLPPALDNPAPAPATPGGPAYVDKTQPDPNPHAQQNRRTPPPLPPEFPAPPPELPAPPPPAAPQAPAAPEPPTFQPAPEVGYDFRNTEAGDPDNELKIPIYGKGGIVGYESRNDQLRRNGGKDGLQEPHGYNPFTEEGMKRKYAESPHMRPQQPQGQPAFGFKHPGNTTNYRAQRAGQPPARRNPGMRTVDDNARRVAQSKVREWENRPGNAQSQAMKDYLRADGDRDVRPPMAPRPRRSLQYPTV